MQNLKLNFMQKIIIMILIGFIFSLFNGCKTEKEILIKQSQLKLKENNSSSNRISNITQLISIPCIDCQPNWPIFCNGDDCIQKLVGKKFKIYWSNCISSNSNSLLPAYQATSNIEFCYSSECNKIIGYIDEISLPCLGGPVCMEYTFTKCDDNGFYNFGGSGSAYDSQGQLWFLSASVSGDPIFKLSATNSITGENCSCTGTIELP